MQLAESFTGKTLIARAAMQTSRQQLHLVFAGGPALMTEPSGRATRQARDKSTSDLQCSLHHNICAFIIRKAHERSVRQRARRVVGMQHVR